MSHHHLSFAREQREHYEDQAAAERDAARDRWFAALASLAAATAEAYEIDGISQEEAENAAILCDQYGQAAALSDVLDTMNREIEASMARAMPPVDLAAMHDATMAALTKGDR